MEQEPAGWPGDDAARDGAPLDRRVGATDPRLVAAERIIAQLRTLLGALTSQAGSAVTVTAEQLRDPRARAVRIRATPDAVELTVLNPPAEPQPDDGDQESPPAAADDRTGTSAPTHGQPPDSALTRRLQRLAEQHPQPDEEDATPG